MGFLVLATISWAAGGFVRPVRWRTVGGSAGLMLIMGLLIFVVPGSRTVLVVINDAVIALLTAGGERGGPRNSDSLLRWDPDPGEGVWHATEETELSG